MGGSDENVFETERDAQRRCKLPATRFPPVKVNHLKETGRNRQTDIPPVAVASLAGQRDRLKNSPFSQFFLSFFLVSWCFMHSATMLMNWCRRTVGSFPVFPPPLSPTVRRIVAPLSSVWLLFTGPVQRMVGGYIPVPVGRSAFFFFFFIRWVTWAPFVLVLFFFSAAIRSRSSSAGGSEPGSFTCPRVFYFYFSFQLLRLMAQREKEWERALAKEKRAWKMRGSRRRRSTEERARSPIDMSFFFFFLKESRSFLVNRRGISFCGFFFFFFFFFYSRSAFNLLFPFLWGIPNSVSAHARDVKKSAGGIGKKATL